MTVTERVGPVISPLILFIDHDRHVRNIRLGHPTYKARAHRESRLWCRSVLIRMLFCASTVQYRNDNTDRYNPSNVGILEDYLYHQIRSREYDCLANLAILKLFVVLSFPFFVFTRAYTSWMALPLFQISVQSGSIQSGCRRKHLGESLSIHSVSRLQPFCRPPGR
jgi:hypothetical protein